MREGGRLREGEEEREIRRAGELRVGDSMRALY